MPDTSTNETSLADSFQVETILVEVSEVVNSIDDLDEVMDRVVGLTSTLLNVKTCSLMMIEPDGRTMTMRAANGLPKDVIESYEGQVGHGISGYVARTGKPLLIEDVETHPRFARKSKSQYSTKSLLSVPLRSQGQTIGVLNVNNRRDGGIFTRSDELLLSVLGNFVVTAIEKAQLRERIREHERYEADLAIAREIQESMLPGEVPSTACWTFAARNVAAREVAGDFFDVISLPEEKTCLVIGDVCGKGVPAAVYMSRVLGHFRVAAGLHSAPEEIMRFVNDLLAPEWTERTFVTALVAVFDDASGQVAFCSAGHHDPLRLSANNTVEEMPSEPGFPLGVEMSFPFEASEVKTEPGDCFFVYTDGVTEAKNGHGDLFGSTRLENALRASGDGAESVADHIMGAIERYTINAERSDDITLLVAKRK